MRFYSYQSKNVKRLKNRAKTRLHSSRMHTARSLTVSPSMLCSGGSCLVLVGGVFWVPVGPAWSWGGACLVRGGYPIMHRGRPPCEQNHRRMWKYYLAPPSLRAVISAPPIDSDVTFVILCPRVVNGTRLILRPRIVNVTRLNFYPRVFNSTRLILCPRVVNITRLFFWPRGFSGGASPRGWTTGVITIRSARSPRSAETAVNTAASPNVS